MASDETFSNTKALPRGKLFTTQSRILKGNTSFQEYTVQAELKDLDQRGR